MDIIDAYQDLGSYRAAAHLCGTTHKTVRRMVERRESGEEEWRSASRPKHTDAYLDLIRTRVKATDGRISAKRLLPLAQAAGYTASARTFRRAVAEVKAAWRRERRTYRPWIPNPGEHLVIDWGEEGERKIFCAVVAWSRYRFVRFASDERRETTLRLLAECFEDIGGVPAVVLSDRMGCLKGGTVAGLMVPHLDYVRFAAHYGFRPDFCEAQDPESKGVVENLVGYAKSDLVIGCGPFATLGSANEEARRWCREVNTRLHTETSAVPQERLETERGVLRPLPSLRPPLRRGETRTVDRLACVRFASARYSVPYRLVGARVEVLAGEGEIVILDAGEEVARHTVVLPGEVALVDEHYGGPAKPPRRALRPRTAAEEAFLALGPVAEAFLRQAAAAGTSRLSNELAQILLLSASWGQDPLLRALERALRFRRHRAEDVAAILAAGEGVARSTQGGDPLHLDLPAVPVRSLSAYRLEVLA
jgi:transposase